MCFVYQGFNLTTGNVKRIQKFTLHYFISKIEIIRKQKCLVSKINNKKIILKIKTLKITDENYFGFSFI
jgi:hypothetical protein